jgi:hypothetical protein
MVMVMVFLVKKDHISKKNISKKIVMVIEYSNDITPDVVVYVVRLFVKHAY